MHVPFSCRFCKNNQTKCRPASGNFGENEEVRQMLFIAEQYLGTTLSRTVTDELLDIRKSSFFWDPIDYLIEYCVSKGSKDIHYIKKVAFSWYENGIDTVTKAKQENYYIPSKLFYYTESFWGLPTEIPSPQKVNTINHWMKDYGFTMDILTEACALQWHPQERRTSDTQTRFLPAGKKKECGILRIFRR